VARRRLVVVLPSRRAVEAGEGRRVVHCIALFCVSSSQRGSSRRRGTSPSLLVLATEVVAALAVEVYLRRLVLSKGAFTWWFTDARFVASLGYTAVGKLLRSCIASVRRHPTALRSPSGSSPVTLLQAELGGSIDLVVTEVEEGPGRVLCSGPRSLM
jgi:hypothetical protein